VTFTKVLTIYQIYHTWIHPLHHSPSSPPAPIPWIVSIGIIFLFICMCTQYLHHTHLLTSFLPPHWCQPLPPQAGPVPPSCSPFCNRKKIPFFLFKIATQRFSLWHFHIYMYYIHLYFSSFYLRPFLMLISAMLKILYSFLYKDYINHIHLLNFLLLCSPSHMWLLLVWLVFHNITVVVLGIYFTNERKYENFGLLNLANFTKTMFSSSIRLPTNNKISFFFVAE
jgi:hypothetical protein